MAFKRIFLTILLIIIICFIPVYWIQASTILTPTNRRAIVLQPFIHEYNSSIDQITNGLISADYSVDYLQNNEVDLSAIESLSHYGVIYIQTHGGELSDGQTILSTGVEVDPDLIIKRETQNLVIVRPKGSDKLYLAFKATYLKERVVGEYPNSLIYIDACHSLENNSLPEAVLNKGAQAVIGWQGETLFSTEEYTSNMFFGQATQPETHIKEAYDYVIQNFPQDNLDIDEPSDYLIKTKYTIGEESFYLNHYNSPPVVSNVIPSGTGIGDGGTGDVTIIYDLVDVDDDICNITLEYQGSSVGADWKAGTVTGQNSGIIPGTGKTIIWNSATDGAGYSSGEYKIKITPNDGTDTGIAGISGFFVINNGPAPNNPPVTTIISPEDGSIYDKEDEITFNGTGNDTEDGTLSGSSLIWTSNIEGQIGTGTSFMRNDLSVGPHTITFTATDSEGATGSNSVVISVNFTAGITKFPDTGQTQDFTSIFGEDSDYNINPPSYIDNGDGTITDKATGLNWQKENERYNWDDAVNFCNNLTLAGHSDWRLPSKKELMTILDYGTYSPSLDKTFFPDTGISYYWTSTTHAYDPFNVWMVWVLYGTALYDSKGFNHEVRCVRGVDYTTGDFSDNGNGTVTDNMTDLMWQKDEGGYNSWEDAIGYCENLSLGGYTDWRLPNIKELESITDDSSNAPVIDTNYFPNAQSSLYWSSTTFASMSSYAYYVDFSSGRIFYYAKWVPFYTRCVRSK